MTSPVPPRDWTAIHWPDIARSEAARWIAVLPLAATEQHGPHLPLSTDALIVRAIVAEALQRRSEAVTMLMLPSLDIGRSKPMS